MPARTTVISSLSKRTDRGHRLLTPSEFLQMAGRAGRRGMDELGHVVTLQTPFEGAKEAAYLATSTPDPLISQFTPSYGMVLNLLQTHTLEEAKELVERSFGQYLATLYLAPQQQAIRDLQAAIAAIEAKLANADQEALNSYQKLQERLREEQRLLKILQQQAEEAQASDMALAMAYAEPGTLVSLKGKHLPPQAPVPVSAVLVSQVPGSGQFPTLIFLGQNNRWYTVTPTDVVALHGVLDLDAWQDVLILPADMPLKPGQSRSGTEATAVVAHHVPDQELAVAPEVLTQQRRVEALESQLSSHPVHGWGNPAALLRLQRRQIDLQAQLQERQAKLSYHAHRHWQEFLALIEILQSFAALEGLNPTPLGEITAALRGDNELWLGLALASGALDQLDPHHLAAAAAALVTEVSRADSWSRYDLSPETMEALSELRSLRRQLFQLQRRQEVVLPIWLEVDLVGLVEQWALGIEWPELCEHTSLDEGDVVRILRRTLDFLSQVPHVPHLSPALKQNAVRAIRLMDRLPVTEVL